MIVGFIKFELASYKLRNQISKAEVGPTRGKVAIYKQVAS